MYYISSLSSNSIKELSAIQNSGHNLKRYFPLALGYIIARNVSLPVEKIEDPVSYFRIQHEITANRIISAINELTPFDVRQAIQDARSFYCFRHEAINPQAIPLFPNKEKAVVDFFSISKHFSNEVIELISNQNTELTQTLVRLSSIYSDIVQGLNESQQPLVAPSDLGDRAA